MAVGIANIIVFLVSIVATMILSAVSRASKSESGKELWGKIVGALIPGAILGAIIGIILSITAVVNLGLSGFLATIILMLVGAGIGAIFFSLFTISTSSFLASIITGVVIGLLLNVFFLTSFLGPAITEYGKTGLEPITKASGSFFKELAKYKYCFQGDPRCPFTVDWSDPVIQNPNEALEVNVDFKENQIRQDNINLLAEISVTNPERYELRLVPKCSLGKTIETSREISIRNMGTYAVGNEFILPMSSETATTSLRCYSAVPECEGKNVCMDQSVFLVLERPVRLQGTWPIYVGQKYVTTGPRLVKTDLKFNAPFSVTLYSNNDMPYDQGKTYDFSLSIKQLDESTELKLIELIRLKFPEDVIGDCEFFSAVGTDELELRNVDKNWLGNNTQYDKTEMKYTIPCSIYVHRAPINAVLAPIEIEADYSVTSTFSQKIFKNL